MTKHKGKFQVEYKKGDGAGPWNEHGFFKTKELALDAADDLENDGYRVRIIEIKD